MTRHDTPLTGLRGKRETVSTQPKGLDFVRAGIALAVGDNIVGQAERYAAERWGRDSRVCKAVLPALNTASAGGDQLVGDEGAAAEFFNVVRAATVLGRLPVRRLPFHVPTLTLDEPAPTSWYQEGKGKGTGTLKLTRQTGLARLIGRNYHRRDQ